MVTIFSNSRGGDGFTFFGDAHLTIGASTPFGSACVWFPSGDPQAGSEQITQVLEHVGIAHGTRGVRSHIDDAIANTVRSAVAVGGLAAVFNVESAKVKKEIHESKAFGVLHVGDGIHTWGTELVAITDDPGNDGAERLWLVVTEPDDDQSTFDENALEDDNYKENADFGAAEAISTRDDDYSIRSGIIHLDEVITLVERIRDEEEDPIAQSFAATLRSELLILRQHVGSGSLGAEDRALLRQLKNLANLLGKFAEFSGRAGLLAIAIKRLLEALS